MLLAWKTEGHMQGQVGGVWKQNVAAAQSPVIKQKPAGYNGKGPGSSPWEWAWTQSLLQSPQPEAHPAGHHVTLAS